jgi:predicted urease superfamily metal-dependent hydrolase
MEQKKVLLMINESTLNQIFRRAGGEKVSLVNKISFQYTKVRWHS